MIVKGLMESFYLNNLTGLIPSSIGNLYSLYGLFLENNHLSGNVPPEVGNLSKVYYLHLSYNQLRGNIPSSLVIFQLSTLWI
jgi:hypothetical protein